jgi:molybdopterin synthase catalytic subunit
MIRIQKEDFNIDAEISRLRKKYKNTGAVVTFVGIARDFSKGKPIESLFFEHYPGMAEKKLNHVRDEAISRFNILDIGIIHRVGKIDIAENIVLIISISQHRKEAFLACQWCIDELKKIVPIWKKETTTDGEIWVEEHP